MAISWLRRLFGGGESEPQEIDRADDPRVGTQSEDYRHADPRDVVEEGGTVMSGPGGAPQEGLSTNDRRKLDRPE